ncbi:MAG TPA: hypothetical protein VFH75_07035 [Actinomycetota bacterium]|nr:hypothetical protein [Actinomycetota bacterium]
MSLVVAQATDEGPRIVSDTRVGFPDDRRPSLKTGTLKAVIVAPGVTVCFAGDVGAGLEGVRGFAREVDKGRAVAGLVPRLQELASDDRRPVEFVVARGGGGSQLTRIRNSGTERSLQSAWIGDQDAFERFQQERNMPRDSLQSALESKLPPAARIMHKLRLAMDAVINDPAIKSVDDFCVAVAHRPNGFEYLGSVFVHVGRDILVQSRDDLISKMAQSVEEGGYAVSVVVPAEPGTPALGLNFPRARMGMLYLPLEFDGAAVIWDVSPNDFPRVPSNGLAWQ